MSIYVFSDDLEEANKIIDNTNAGGAAINCVAIQGALPSLGLVDQEIVEWEGIMALRDLENFPILEEW
jgi:hypothetical protein